MTHVTCRLTAKNRDQLRNPTLGSGLWATFTFLLAKKQPFFFAVTSTKACTELTVALHTSYRIVGDRAVKVDE